MADVADAGVLYVRSILSLAAICFVFAHRERRYGGPTMRVAFHRA